MPLRTKRLDRALAPLEDARELPMVHAFAGALKAGVVTPNTWQVALGIERPLGKHAHAQLAPVVTARLTQGLDLEARGVQRFEALLAFVRLRWAATCSRLLQVVEQWRRDRFLEVSM